MPESASIIFVDDDPHVLSGLRRRIVSKRPNWKLRFCTSGAEALVNLDQHSADVIVSDMRMPEMDGAELLRSVARKYPDTARILLSGYADEQAIQTGLAATHHFLMKPCSDQEVIHAIERGLILRNYLRDPQLINILYRMPAELVWPPVFYRLHAILQYKGPHSQNELQEFSFENPGFIMLVCEMARREKLILPTEGPDLVTLIDLFGLETIKALCVIWTLHGQQTRFDPDNIDQPIDRCLILGNMAAGIAKLEGMPSETIDLIRAAALLCHIGLNVMEHVIPDQVALSRKQADDDQCDIISTEIGEIGVSHPAVSACLAALWGFKHEIVENIAFHHRPEAAPTRDSLSLLIVYAAQHFARKFGNDRHTRAAKYDRASGFIAHCDAQQKWANWERHCAPLGDNQA
ncbi:MULTISPECIES: response regulator [Thalassospira]|uniref:Metal-dependent hydrolase HDOD n=2 Tax=Thalassospira TaxID=168934 RepID=A0AB72UIV5_9PROT|nr:MULTISPECIES: response regulator [Thalassospira]MBR9779021.1 response regulator [Rhodospirillales bacterium]AJD53992.1 metal-dependent hydrolase HDOD [Thalassospira xiamenensis M-5 = DSM 17429]KEO57588.1 metal-dependent hydrolase [Thalassospira permensis NBRC 106175]MBR9818057.1 response regulator [Rhodospirillales bacterium]SIS60090.1 HDOD domain-containing protein [Thalassospira xiamenensis M-5 = DSM 17429]